MQTMRVLYPFGDRKKYKGKTAIAIMKAFRSGHPDFSETKNLDEYLAWVAQRLSFELSGDTTEERAESFLQQFTRNGYGSLITEDSEKGKFLNDT